VFTELKSPGVGKEAAASSVNHFSQRLLAHAYSPSVWFGFALQQVLPARW
jgi:hypothetical protein